MKLNINFDSTLEETINLCSPLADWFERNQETMAYFELIHKGCTQFDNSPLAKDDVITLGKMANACLTWLEAPEIIPVSPKEKAVNAALSIAMVYEKEKISEYAKVQYYIDLQTFQKDKDEEKSLVKKIR